MRARFSPCLPSRGTLQVRLSGCCVLRQLRKVKVVPFKKENNKPKAKRLPKNSTTNQTNPTKPIFFQFWKGVPFLSCSATHLTWFLYQVSAWKKFHLQSYQLPANRWAWGKASSQLGLVCHMELCRNDGGVSHLPAESFPWNDDRVTPSKDVSLESCWQIYWPPGQTTLPFLFGIMNYYALSLLIRLLASCVVPCPCGVTKVTLPTPSPSSPALFQEIHLLLFHRVTTTLFPT